MSRDEAIRMAALALLAARDEIEAHPDDFPIPNAA